MKKKLVVNKGYTITVVSWENDGDFYNTESITVNTYKEAELYFQLIKFYQENLNNQGKIDGDQIVLIQEFINEHKPLYIFEFHDTCDSLIGTSGCGDGRVVESCVVTYSSEDVHSSVIFEI